MNRPLTQYLGNVIKYLQECIIVIFATYRHGRPYLYVCVILVVEVRTFVYFHLLHIHLLFIITTPVVLLSALYFFLQKINLLAN